MTDSLRQLQGTKELCNVQHGAYNHFRMWDATAYGFESYCVRVCMYIMQMCKRVYVFDAAVYASMC